MKWFAQIERRFEMCLDAETQDKFNNKSTVIDETLSNQKYLYNKVSLGYERTCDIICVKNKDFIPKQQDASYKNLGISTK